LRSGDVETTMAREVDAAFDGWLAGTFGDAWI
jgi:hypothetical protein